MQDILNILKETQTPFMYHEDLNLEYCSNNKSLNKEEVLVKYYTNYFTVSDLVIVKALSKIVFGTNTMIWKVLELFKRKYPKMPVLTDAKLLKNRLTVLTKSSIIKRFKFIPIGGNSPHSYYCITPHGYNYIKRIMNFKDKYDEYIGVTPPDEVMKYLASVAVAEEFIDHDSFIDFNVDVSFYTKELGLQNIYVEVKTNVNDKENTIIIEPLYFKFDTNRMSEEEYMLNLRERLRVIEKYISTKVEDDTPTIMFVCENVSGIKQAMELASEHLALYKNYMYFTTDSVTHKMGVKGVLRIEAIENNKPAGFTDEIFKEFV